jgi:hypothetical protein
MVNSMNLDRSNGDASGKPLSFSAAGYERACHLASAEYLFGRVRGAHVLPLRHDRRGGVDVVDVDKTDGANEIIYNG